MATFASSSAASASSPSSPGGALPPAGGGPGAGGASKAFLGVAVVLGVLATVLAFTFIESSAGADRGPKVRVVVASRDLRPNVAIDPERDLKVEEIPTKFSSLAAQCLDWDARATYKGQRLNRRVLANQPVFLADLSAVGELTLAPGARALTIPAEPGIVIPGDYVKVIVSRPEVAGLMPATTEGGGTAALPAVAGRPGYQAAILGPANGFRVLAVGGSLFKTRQQVTAADQYEAGAANNKAVTLEVTEEQAAEITRSMGPSQQRATLLLCAAKEKLEAAGTQP